jgi:hypothetical protein
MANELKNCPFCGGIEKVKCTLFMSVFQVQCFECKSSAYGSNNKDQAVTAWNTRPAAPVEGLERYSLEEWNPVPRHYSYIEPDVNGDYVRFEQAEELLAAANNDTLAAEAELHIVRNDLSKQMSIVRTTREDREIYRNRAEKAEADNAALTVRVTELEETVRDDITFAKGLKNQLAADRKALRNIDEDEGAPFRIKVHALATLEGEP